MHILYLLLDALFLIFHTALIVFNLFGWIFPKTRKWNLLTLALTAFSWGVLGYWYGWGYCICTDWHWRIRQKLGYVNDSPSYIQFLLRHLTGIDFSMRVVTNLTAVCFVVSVAGSVGFNLRDYLRKRRAHRTTREDGETAV